MLDTREPLTDENNRQTGRTRFPRGARGATRRFAEHSRGIRVERYLTRKGSTAFDQVEWERRNVTIIGDKGETLFFQEGVDVPTSWSMLATNVVASKYFYGRVGEPQREYSVRQLVHRVARTIADWGLSAGYFASAEDAEVFYQELCAITVQQYGSFNSPVWFNVGLYQVYGHVSPSRTSYAYDPEKRDIVPVTNAYERPQASACFIQSVQDTMEDIMRLAATEAMLFKHGSGTGTDLSTLRSSREKLSSGGTPSGPLSFMRVFDQVAAVIKSGGKTRRAAKMQSLRVDHPDIKEFVSCKVKEEKKAWALIDAGYDGRFGGEAYDSVMFQNCNLAVRVTDEFMQAVEKDGTFQTRAVTTGKPVETLKARELLRAIAEATHLCGDPGLQYDTTINRWNTCANSGRIHASNPCSEFMFLDDSACNLASVNLTKFVDETGEFDRERFRHVVRLLIIAQDILVDGASYPTPAIARHSHCFRPLGLGYANLGALFMSLGMPYDSDAARSLAAGLTSLMTGYAYAASQEIAEVLGSFEEFDINREPMLRVIRQHQAATEAIDAAFCPPQIRQAAIQIWNEVVANAETIGFRNAQVTLLAPTGTIGFMMDCDTTGIEPDIALVKYKQLAGGGQMKLVNRTVRVALQRLGYAPEDVDTMVHYVDEKETIEGAPGLKAEHLPVFDCAFRPRNGTRCIPYKAHLHMMAAVQPFLSGAISKTVNLPTETTVDEIMEAYVEGWKLGLKAVALYRDGSKRTQPLSTRRAQKADVPQAPATPPKPFRRRMPLTRQSITHKFEIAGHEGYLTVGMYEDGTPGELFITMAKEGSTVGGTMDAFGTAISLCLQYGVPLRELCQKFAHSRFEPSGFTKNPEIPIAKSIVDYIFRWLEATFPDGRARSLVPSSNARSGVSPSSPVSPAPGGDVSPTSSRLRPSSAEEPQPESPFQHFMADAPACDNCGAITVRNGSCYRCYNCGNSMGCS